MSSSASFNRGISHFPLELTHTIIDFLDNNPAALANCALVCRAWVYRSRVHLFQGIRFKARNPAIIDRFIQLLKPPDSDATDASADADRQTMILPISTFHHHVRYVEFDQRPEGNVIEQQGFEFSPELLRWLSHCSGISGVAINSCVGVMGSSALLIPAAFPNVTRLFMNNLEYKYEDVACLSNFISGFPLLEMLNLYVQFDRSVEILQGDSEESNEHGGSFATISPYIRVVHLSTNLFKPLCRWLSASHQQLSKLKVLRIESQFAQDLHSVGTLISKAGPWLEKLMVQLFYDEVPAGWS